MCEKMQKIIDEEIKDAAKKTAEKLIKTTDWDDEHIAEIASLSKEVVAEIRTALLQNA